MTDNLKKLYVTQMNGIPQLYTDGLTIIDSVYSVVINGAVYTAKNNNVVTSTGKKSIVSLVQSGVDVYYLS